MAQRTHSMSRITSSISQKQLHRARSLVEVRIRTTLLRVLAETRLLKNDPHLPPLQHQLVKPIKSRKHRLIRMQRKRYLLLPFCRSQVNLIILARRPNLEEAYWVPYWEALDRWSLNNRAPLLLKQGTRAARFPILLQTSLRYCNNILCQTTPKGGRRAQARGGEGGARKLYSMGAGAIPTIASISTMYNRFSTKISKVVLNTSRMLLDVRAWLVHEHDRGLESSQGGATR